MNYIFRVLILITILVVAMYIFMFRRRRRMKDKTFDSVKEYHEAFEKHRLSNRRSSYKPNNYVTKYNSSEDYREKTETDFSDI